MHTSIPVQDMSVEEKLAAMELLWDDLSRHADDRLSPAWHGDELAAREVSLAAGTERIEDWSDARQKIRDHTHT